jgi:hypothetical protein
VVVMGVWPVVLAVEGVVRDAPARAMAPAVLRTG